METKQPSPKLRILKSQNCRPHLRAWPPFQEPAVDLIRPPFLQAPRAVLREDLQPAEAEVDGRRAEAEVDGHQATAKVAGGGYPPEVQEAAAGHRLRVDREAARQKAGDHQLVPCGRGPPLASARWIPRLWVLRRGRQVTEDSSRRQARAKAAGAEEEVEETPPDVATYPQGQDPYVSGRTTAILAPGHKRMAFEVYWQIRQSGAQGVREFLTSYYLGLKHGQGWRDIWAAAQQVDVSLHRTYVTGGFNAVQWALNTDDLLEVSLSRIAAQWAFLRTNDQSLLISLQAGKPPGEDDLAPGWSTQAARDLNKSEHAAWLRNNAGGAVAPTAEPATTPTGAYRCPRRRGGTSADTTQAVAETPNTPAGGQGGGATRAGGAGHSKS